MYENQKTLGKFMRNRRKKLELTLEDVSEMSFVSLQTVWRLENAKVLPQFDTLEALSLI